METVAMKRFANAKVVNTSNVELDNVSKKLIDGILLHLVLT